MDKSSPIGIFDSGLGGISVAAQIHALLPEEDLIFFGDSKYNPYGTKSKEEISQRCRVICDFFMERGCKAIVIACNTATSASVPMLRKTYPVDIIGMEPALKVAAQMEGVKTIAVWATQLTLKEEKFARLMERFASSHTVIPVPCPKLVRIVEEDRLDDAEMVEDALQEYLAESQKADAIVLGCTHFVFFKEALKELANQGVRIVDGNFGTANHLKDLLQKKDLLNTEGGQITWHNTLNKIEQSQRLFERMEDVL